MKNITIGNYTLEVNTENPTAELLTESLGQHRTKLS